MFFCSPHFDHDAFTHHAFHVLGAPESTWCKPPEAGEVVLKCLTTHLLIHSSSPSSTLKYPFRETTGLARISVTSGMKCGSSPSTVSLAGGTSFSSVVESRNADPKPSTEASRGFPLARLPKKTL